MTPFINLTLAGFLLVLAVCCAWFIRRRFREMQRTLAVEHADVLQLQGRLDEAVALFESRLLRLEGVKGAAGSRIQRRRQAADLVRHGADPLAAAKRCDLPLAELEVLLKITELRARQATNASN